MFDDLDHVREDDTFYHDSWLSVYQGDCRDVLARLPEKSVHAVVTSPPYFGLRSYLDDDDPNKQLEVGREVSPYEYVAAMVEVFRGIWRVLRDDGTVWLNLGDTYNNRAKVRTSSHQPSLNDFEDDNWSERAKKGGVRMSTTEGGLKEKDLIGVPWRCAFALQEDGWYLRSDVIWSKPNPMPSSASDRPSTSHEYVFLLSKQPSYYYDIDGTRVPHKPITLERIKYGLNQNHPDGLGIAVPPVRTTQVEGADRFDTAQVTKEAMGDRFANPLGRNLRTVWEVPTVPYPDAHYAVFPPKLIEPCIKASTSERGVCAVCGAPWLRITEKESVGKTRDRASGGLGTDIRREPLGYDAVGGEFSEGVIYRTIGWRPSCAHEGEPIPATVLDPFAGSGTVGMVAQALSRRSILIDLNMKYLAQQLKRNAQVPLGL